MKFKIANKNDYTSSKFGDFLKIHMDKNIDNVSIIEFKNHIFIIVNEKKFDNYLVITSDFVMDEEESNYYKINRKNQKFINVNNYKNIGNIIIKEAIIQYPEYDLNNFPVDLFEILFVDDIENFAYSVYFKDNI